jgi:multisubunit Na+/H+ antiporter MnhE subunit
VAWRLAEAAFVGAGLGMLVMTAFRDQIAGPVRTVAGLVALTLIAGAAGALIAAAAQVAWSAMRKRGSASGVGEPGSAV